MDIQTLTTFLMWCTLVNVGFLILFALIFLTARDLVYRIHSQWFSFSRETFDLVFYSFLGIYKVFFIFFNLVPWLVLHYMG
jgi:hypothetical protein